MQPRVILPGVGAGPFELGRTRDELWARTDSDVLAFLGKSGPGERSDDFLMHGITAHYRDGRVVRLSVFPRMPKIGIVPIELEGEDISRFTREDVVAFLELRGLARVDDIEQIRVPSLGLIFGFRQDFGRPEELDFVFVDQIQPKDG
jgi:hypothetical protein